MRSLLGSLIVFCAVPITWSQIPSTPSAAHLPESSGTLIVAKLQVPISSEKIQIGDIVRFKVLKNVVNDQGQILIPKGAKLFSEVTDVRSAWEDKDHWQAPKISLIAYRAEWKHGARQLKASLFGFVTVKDDGKPNQYFETTAGYRSLTLQRRESVSSYYYAPPNVPVVYTDSGCADYSYDTTTGVGACTASTSSSYEVGGGGDRPKGHIFELNRGTAPGSAAYLTKTDQEKELSIPDGVKMIFIENSGQ